MFNHLLFLFYIYHSIKKIYENVFLPTFLLMNHSRMTISYPNNKPRVYLSPHSLETRIQKQRLNKSSQQVSKLDKKLFSSLPTHFSLKPYCRLIYDYYPSVVVRRMPMRLHIVSWNIKNTNKFDTNPRDSFSIL